jgi:hypothetical protein
MPHFSLQDEITEMSTRTLIMDDRLDNYLAEHSLRDTPEQ